MNITEEQLARLISKAVREVFKDNKDEVVVLHEHCPLSSDDVAFFRRLKHSIDKTASWVGHGFILMILAAVAYIVKIGIEAWRTVPNG